MDASEYQRLAGRTSDLSKKRTERIHNAVYGLVGESGEIVDVIKKEVFHHHDPDINKILDESGDLLWYLAELLSLYGLNMSDVMSHNINKLLARYPLGFDPEHSRQREST